METRKITSVVVVDAERLRRGRRAPARPVAHADVLIAMRGPGLDAIGASALLLFDVDGVLTDGAILVHADGSESKPFHIRDGAGARLGAARRAVGRAALGARVGRDGAARGAAGHPDRRRRASPTSSTGYDGSCATQGLSDDRGRLHGRRPAGSAGAAARRASRPRRPTRRPRSARACTGSAPSAGGRGAVRELHRARPARAGPLGRRRAASTCAVVMASYAALLVALVALLAGLAVGKAWERYKLAGRPLDRSPPRPRVAALHAGPELPRRQPDRSGDRGAEQGGRSGGRRSARDPPHSRQPVSREGPGRPRDPGAPEPAAAAQPAHRSSTPTSCSASASTTGSGGFVDRALEAFSEVLRLDPEQPATRCRTSRSCTKISTSGRRRTRRGSSWPRADAPEQPSARHQRDPRLPRERDRHGGAEAVATCRRRRGGSRRRSTLDPRNAPGVPEPRRRPLPAKATSPARDRRVGAADRSVARARLPGVRAARERLRRRLGDAGAVRRRCAGG